MQIIQIPRGDIRVRMNTLPLLQGEYFFDTGSQGANFTDAALYIGTGTKNTTEWTPSNVSGGYLRIGGTGGLTVEGHISEFPTAHGKYGAIWIADNDIQVPADTIFNVVSDGTEAGSNGELKRGDFLIDLNTEWVKINNSGGAAPEISFYSTHSNTLAGTTNVQEALYALDSKKLSYGGELTVEKGLTYILGDTRLATLVNKVTEEIEAYITDGDISQPAGDNSAVTYDVNLASEWAKIQGSLFSVSDSCSIIDNDGNKIYLDQGDFVVFTASKSWASRGANVGDKYLLGSDIEVRKIPGGTHDSSKLYITNANLKRPLPGDRVYNNDEYDGQISTIEDALSVLYGTKADIDPSTGKILLNELPDTIIGAMEYQGIHNEQTVPTASNKGSVDTDEDPDTVQDLVKGDYWIYSGDTWTLTEEDLTKITKTGKTGADGNYTITNGDWLVWNGEKFDVLDNTSEFIGIRVDGNEAVLQGTVVFKGSTRTHDGEEIDEVQAVQDNETNSVVYKAEKAVLAPVDVARNTIYRADGDRVAKASNLVDNDERLTITEQDGIILKSDTEGSVTHTINHGTSSAVNALPSADGTLAIDEDIGVGEAENQGTDWTAPMYDTNDSGRKVLKDSFLKFLSKANSQLKGIELKDGDTRDVEIRLSSRTKKTIQVLPILSGYILNSNSVIDCGVWDSEHPNGYTPNEGHGVLDNTSYAPAAGDGDDLSILGEQSNGVINTVKYTDDTDDSGEIIEAIITDGTVTNPTSGESGSGTGESGDSGDTGSTTGEPGSGGDTEPTEPTEPTEEMDAYIEDDDD